MELGEVIRVTLPAFYVVGKEGKVLLKKALHGYRHYGILQRKILKKSSFC